MFNECRFYFIEVIYVLVMEKNKRYLFLKNNIWDFFNC